MQTHTYRHTQRDGGRERVCVCVCVCVWIYKERDMHIHTGRASGRAATHSNKTLTHIQTANIDTSHIAYIVTHIGTHIQRGRGHMHTG